MPAGQPTYENYLTGQAGGGTTGYSGAQVYGSVPTQTQPIATGPLASGQAAAAGQNIYQQLPGYNASIGNVGANIQSETAGQVPADVLRQLQTQGAERGVATGTVGSDDSNAAYLQALGLTSLNLTNMGQSNLQNILPTLPGYGISQNPNFYVSSGQQLGAGQYNANLAAAPNPTAAGQAALGAVQSGVGAGINSVPTPGGLTSPTLAPITQPTSGIATGSGINPGWDTSLNNATASQIDKILAQYNPLNTDQSTPWDSEQTYNETADLAAAGAPSWMQDYYGGLNTGTEVSATAPAGTSGGYYYAGDNYNTGGGGGD